MSDTMNTESSAAPMATPTPMPIAIPARVTVELLDCLKRSRLTAWMVVHANHPNEIIIITIQIVMLCIKNKSSSGVVTS